ncbi:hypothetical protein OG216_45105 [Streptomycetaceae bacterium NBC_01309]
MTHLLVDGTALESAVRTPYEADGEPVLRAVLIAAAAGAFRTGTRLREDAEGLV